MSIIKKLSLFSILLLSLSAHSNNTNKDSVTSLITKGIIFGTFTGLASNAAVTAAGGLPLQLIEWPTAFALRLVLGNSSAKSFNDQEITNNTSCLAAWIAYFIPLPIK